MELTAIMSDKPKAGKEQGGGAGEETQSGSNVWDRVVLSKKKPISAQWAGRALSEIQTELGYPVGPRLLYNIRGRIEELYRLDLSTYQTAKIIAHEVREHKKMRDELATLRTEIERLGGTSPSAPTSARSATGPQIRKGGAAHREASDDREFFDDEERFNR